MKRFMCPLCSDIVEGDDMSMVWHFIKEHGYSQTTVEDLNKRFNAWSCSIDDFVIGKK